VFKRVVQTCLAVKATLSAVWSG